MNATLNMENMIGIWSLRTSSKGRRRDNFRMETDWD